jgi:excinuclease ABC subunit A
VLVDQTPIGRTTRSNPASYVGAFDAIRKRFAATPLARERKYTQGRSASTRARAAAQRAAATASSMSRCSSCRTCTCVARIATASAIAPRCWTSRSTAGRSPDVLELTIAEARAFFAGDRDIDAALAPLADVGLDYLRLGQPVPTLSAAKRSG